MWFPVVRTPLKSRRQYAVVSSVMLPRRTPRRGTEPWSTAKLCTYIPLVLSSTDNLNGKGYTVDLHYVSNTLNTLIGERGGLVVNTSDSGSRGRGFEPHSGQTVLCP